MIDNRIGKRFKQCREALGLTQSEFAEKAGFTVNYISTIERGTTFPLCDVLDHSPNYMSSVLSEKLSVLPSASQKRILQVVELMIHQELGACNTQTQASTTGKNEA